MSPFLYILAWRVIRFLPMRLVRNLFAFVARFFYRKNGKQVKQLRKNLAIVTNTSGPELEDLVLAGLVSYSRYWAEAFKLPSFSQKKIDNLVKIDNREILLEPARAGKGVVVAVAHLANWDLAGSWFAQQAGELVTVAERLKPERLFDAFLSYRKSIGLIAYPAKDRETVTALKRALEAGKIVALVADRDFSDSGIPVMFCGQPCTMPAGPASLAYSTNSVLTTACLYNETNYLAGFVDEPIEIDMTLSREDAIRKATEEMAERFTRYVQKHPTDWHVLQRVWSSNA
jgi:KDO2-lipid IV(A) lauroyltransferase